MNPIEAESSAREAVAALEHFANRNVLGQERLVRRLMIALLADGHLLVEGAPGLAKTRLVRLVASGIEGSFRRIQFTPDLLPADLTGTEVFRPEEATFHFVEGPLFHNFILADEINRSPAKVQSALLEAMGERQITVGQATYPLPKLFLVMATQNPIEQEGTYPLPEAQRDRFMLHVEVDYPGDEEELEILRLVRGDREAGIDFPEPPHALSQPLLFEARKALFEVYLAPELERYLVRLVTATRHPAPHDPALAEWIEYGASPRATLALDLTARAMAWLEGRDYVSPADIQALAPDVLRHRLLLSYEAQADRIGADRVIERLLAVVAVP